MKSAIYKFCITLFVIISTSCTTEKSITIDDIFLTDLQNQQGRYSFTFSEIENTPKLVDIKENRIYLINNLDRFGKVDNYIYAFIDINDEQSKKGLLVYDLSIQTFDWCYYYTNTSYFFEEQLICFSVAPYTIPLQQLYKINVEIKDFRNSFSTKREFEGRNWAGSDYQDFYYINPTFFSTTTTDKSLYYLYKKDKEKEQTVLCNLWEQANFPLWAIIYYPDEKKTIYRIAYPDENDAEQYIPISKERKKSELQQVTLNYINSDLNIHCSQTTPEKEIAIVYEAEEELSWNNISVIISDSKKQTKIPLSSIFKYQDSLKGIYCAGTEDDNAFFIIQTKEFSYDFIINLDNLSHESYLRASSFPEKIRYPE